MNRLINTQEIFDKTISCSEKGKKLEFLCNSKQFYKVKIDSPDNAILQNKDSRCDYAIVDCNIDNIALFIELKGNDLNWAFEQILCSKNEFGKDFKNLYGAIVYGGSPAKTSEQNLYKKSKNKGLKVLFIKRNSLALAYDSANNIIIKKN